MSLWTSRVAWPPERQTSLRGNLTTEFSPALCLEVRVRTHDSAPHTSERVLVEEPMWMCEGGGRANG